MAAVGVGNKYNVALNGVGYLLRGLNYRKRDLPAFVPRFNTGEQGEGELDTWKTITQKKFSGFGQKDWGEDDTLVDSLLGAMPDFDGQRLVPTAPCYNESVIHLARTATATIANPCVWTLTSHGLLNGDEVMFRSTGALPTGIFDDVKYYVVNKTTNTFQIAETPGGAAISTLGGSQSGTHTCIGGDSGIIDPPTCGCVFKGVPYFAGYAYVAKQTYPNVDFWEQIPGLSGITADVTALINAGSFMYAICPTDNKIVSFDGTTWSTKSSTTTSDACVFNNKLYVVTTTGKLYSSALVAGASLSFTDLGYLSIEKTLVDGESSMCVFNHRLYISKRDGLFVYDGVTVMPVMTDSSSYNNYRRLTVFNGAMYYLSGDRDLYRFNGATVEHIYRFSGQDNLPYCLASVNGRLLIGTVGAGVLAYDGISVFPACQDFMIIDGVTYQNYPYIRFIVPHDTAGDSTIYVSHGFADGVGIFRSAANPTIASNYVGIDYAEVITSAFDCGFPRVSKWLESITLDVYDIQSGVVNVYYRLFDGFAWGSWQDAGDITSTVDTLYLRDTAGLTGTFKKVQFKFVLNDFLGETGLDSFSFDYYIAPDYKREWRIDLLCVGNSETPQTLLDGSDETNYAETLRENIYDCRASVAPVGFEDVDYIRTNGAVTTTATSITVDDTKTFADSGYIKIDSEIIKYTGKSATQFTGCVRGVLGTTAATHTDNTIVNSYYRVILSEIINEEVYSSSEGPISPAVNRNESVISVVLKEA